MTLSKRRRLSLSVLLGLEAVALVLAITLFFVPWDTTFSEFENRPISTGEAYLHTAPVLLMLVGLLVAVGSLWVRAGRAARLCVSVTSALHVLIAIGFLTGLGGTSDGDLIYAAVVNVAYAGLLLAILGRSRGRVLRPNATSA